MLFPRGLRTVATFPRGFQPLARRVGGPGFGGAGRPDRSVGAWMGRPVDTKGLMSLPYLLAMEKRLIVRAWTGAETAALE